jgi:hypothetical protein
LVDVAKHPEGATSAATTTPTLRGTLWVDALTQGRLRADCSPGAQRGSKDRRGARCEPGEEDVCGERFRRVKDGTLGTARICGAIARRQRHLDLAFPWR